MHYKACDVLYFQNIESECKSSFHFNFLIDFVNLRPTPLHYSML